MTRRKINLTEILQNEKLREIFRFGIIGLLATGIHYGVYLLLLYVVSPNISYTIGYVVSFCFNFFLTNVFTFKTKPNVKKGLGFILSHSINYGLQMLLLNVFICWGVPERIVPILVYTIAIPVNFILVRFAFKSKWTQ